MSDTCGICGAPMGNDDYYSAYTPYPTHADKSICVANIRADERERIAQAIEALPAAYIAAGVWEDPGADHDHDGWDGEPVVIRSEAARIARSGGHDV